MKSKIIFEIVKALGFLALFSMLLFMVYRELKPKRVVQSAPTRTTIIKEMVEQDALMKEVTSLRFKVDSVKNIIYDSEELLQNMDKDYQQYFENLQKIRNEKISSPSASMREQYDVITTARYNDF